MILERVLPSQTHPTGSNWFGHCSHPVQTGHSGWRIAGEEQHQMEVLPQVCSPQNCGRWKLGLMEPERVDQQGHHQLVGHRQALSHAVHLDDPGQKVTRAAQ